MKPLVIAALMLLSATITQAELPSASEALIKQAMASGQPVVIDLGARSCIPCKEMARWRLAVVASLILFLPHPGNARKFIYI